VIALVMERVLIAKLLMRLNAYVAKLNFGTLGLTNAMKVAHA
jgi:hypothetical protein